MKTKPKPLAKVVTELRALAVVGTRRVKTPKLFTITSTDLTWLRGWAKRGINFEHACAASGKADGYYADQLARLKGVGK